MMEVVKAGCQHAIIYAIPAASRQSRYIDGQPARKLACVRAGPMQVRIPRMSFARIWVLAAAVLFAPVVAAAAPTADEIAKAIEDLSAGEFDVRQAATETLWQ